MDFSKPSCVEGELLLQRLSATGSKREGEGVYTFPATQG